MRKSEYRIFIGSLSPYITSAELYEHFSMYGAITHAEVISDFHTGMSF